MFRKLINIDRFELQFPLSARLLSLRFRSRSSLMRRPAAISPLSLGPQNACRRSQQTFQEWIQLGPKRSPTTPTSQLRKGSGTDSVDDDSGA